MFTTHAIDDSTLTAAIQRRATEPRNLPIYDDGIGSLYVYGNEYGAVRVIRALSWESAYEIAIDESAPIDDDEIHEAYGFDYREDFDTAIESLAFGAGDWPDLCEGYQYQANATGSGIVFAGYHELLVSVEDYNRNRGADFHIVPVFTLD